MQSLFVKSTIPQLIDKKPQMFVNNSRIVTVHEIGSIKFNR